MAARRTFLVVQWDRQFKSMFAEEHRWATLGVLVSVIFTIALLAARVTGIVVALFAVVEALAILWYVATYLPFVQQYVRGFLCGGSSSSGGSVGGGGGASTLL